MPLGMSEGLSVYTADLDILLNDSFTILHPLQGKLLHKCKLHNLLIFLIYVPFG